MIERKFQAQAFYSATKPPNFAPTTSNAKPSMIGAKSVAVACSLAGPAVGLESDLRAFAKVGISAVLVAVIGVAVPFVLGWLTAAWLLPDSPALSHVFIG